MGDSIGLSFKSGSELGKPTESIQMPMYQAKEDNSDMRLDFNFESDLGQSILTDKSKSMSLPPSMHMVQSSTAELNLKIASVKKVSCFCVEF